MAGVIAGLVARRDTTPAVPADEPKDATALLRDLLPAMQGLRVFEAQARGPIHALLSCLPGYVCSEYLPEVPRGMTHRGVRCEDLMALTFASNRFDLVITQDVVEHVADPDTAFREIRRVLRPGGHHVFTDFGADLPDRLQRIGFATTVHTAGSWYPPEEATGIGDGAAHAHHLRSVAERGLPSFRYNSVVFAARCLKLPQSEERFQPEVRGEVAYEHWHRYRLARDLVGSGVVVDIACGEGYGTAHLAGKARRVIGVDLSAEVITYARERYAHVSNAEFRVGSCIAIPVDSGSADAVVSFETIEHIAEHESFVAEVLRVLGPHGRFIVSTPNKAIYTDAAGHVNPFHTRELYRDEFAALLGSRFELVRLLGQRLSFSSHIWPEADDQLPEARDQSTEFVHYGGSGPNGTDDLTPPFEPTYFVAVCDRSAAADPAFPTPPALDASTGATPRPIPPLPASLFTEPEDDLLRQVQQLRQNLWLAGRQLRIPHDDRPAMLAREPRLAILVLTKSKLPMLFRCIDAIVTRTRYRNFRLVIGDTGSTEAERAAIAAFLAHYPGLDAWLIAFPDYHFARCNNALARRHAGAETELLLFCNNDVVLVNDAISRLVAVYLEHGDACGTLGCRLHFENNAIQHAGIQLLAHDGGLRLTHRGIGTYADFGAIERGTLGNTGAFLMIRRDLFERLGGFDEGYRDCYQDVALNLECILAGHENFFDGSAVAYHYESQTRSRQIPPEDGARLASFLQQHPDPRITRLISHPPAR